MPTSGSRISSTARSSDRPVLRAGSATVASPAPAQARVTRDRPRHDQDRGSPPPRSRRKANRSRGGRGGLPRNPAARPRHTSRARGDDLELELRFELQLELEHAVERRQLRLRLDLGGTVERQHLYAAGPDECLLSRSPSPPWASKWPFAG